MATSTAVGGSQIDARSLATQLVAAERAPLDQQITRDSAKLTTKLSALGTLKGALSKFKDALSALKTEEVFAVRRAVSSNADVFAVSADSSAIPGSYGVEVVQLARAHQLASSVVAGGNTAVIGTGTLTLSVGTSSFSVVIDGTNSTLAGIRDAINAAADNTGIAATIVRSGTGSSLVLSSSKTGAANAISISQSGGNGGLASLTYGPGATTNYTQLAAAQDAIIRVAGFQSQSATNTVNGAIDGVTLSLKSQAPGDILTLTVSHDTATAADRVRKFVAEYNALQGQVLKLRSFDAATGNAGPMLGDALLTGIESQIRRTLSTPVSNATPPYTTLASIGITTKSDGTLTLNETKLQTALDGGFDAVGALFGSEGGVASRMFSDIEARLNENGAIEARNKGLAKQKLAIDKRQKDVDARMETVLQRYIKQFTTLDTLLSKLQTTSSYLSQQIDSLANLK